MGIISKTYKHININSKKELILSETIKDFFDLKENDNTSSKVEIIIKASKLKLDIPPELKLTRHKVGPYLLRPRIYVKHSLEDLDFGPVDRYLRKLRKRHTKRAINKTDKNKIKILDVGCGKQASLGCEMHKDEKYVYWGLDRDVPNTTIDNVNLVTGTAEEITTLFKPNTFDVVVALALIEHLENPKKFVEDVYKVLDKSGVFILTTPPPIADPILKVISSIGIINGDEIEEHKTYFTKKTLPSLLTENKFKVLEAKSFLFGFNNIFVAKKT